MKSAFNTETLRSITHSLGRFLAIAAIVALGTGFYAGLRMTAPDMKLAADEYFDGTSLMDIRVLSTLGLTDDDIAALRHVEGVEAVMPARETDVMASIDGEQYATRVHSLPDAARTSDTSDGVHARSDDPDYLNRPLLVRGSWPQKTGECVLSANLVENDAIAVGDTLTITEGVQDVDQTLVTRTYTVTGFVNAPYYATSSSMGETTLGSGSIQQYMYVPESDFSADLPYTEAYLAVRGVANERASSDAYQRLVDEVADRIKALAPEREQARVDQLKSDAQKELDEKRADYERERADAQSQLDDAKRQLDDAAATIAASEQGLADGQAAYDSGASELASRRASAQAQLDDAERQIAEGQAQLDAQRPQLDDAAGQLQAARAQWQQGADALAAAWGDWQRQSDELDAGITRAQAGVADAAAGVDRIQKGIDALEEQIKQLDPDKDAQKIAELRAEQDALKAQQQDLRAQMALVQATLDDLVNVQKPKLEAARAELQGKQDVLDSSKVELEQQQAAYEGGRLSSTRAPGSLIRRAPISPHRARKPTRRSPRLSSSSTTPPLGCRTAAPSSNKVAPTTTAASPNTSRRNPTPMRSWRTPSVASTTPRSRSTIWSAPNGWSWTARRTTVQPASRRTPTAWTASPRCSRSSSSSWRLSWPSPP